MSNIDFNTAFLNGFGKDDRRPKAKKAGNAPRQRRSLKTGFSGDYSVMSNRDNELLENLKKAFPSVNEFLA